jgi:hypothetical protein
MNDYVIVETNYDYADEFNVPGFAVMPATEWRDIQEKVRKAFVKIENVPRHRYRDIIEVYFGSNEALSFNSADEVLRATVKTISEAYAKVITQVIGESFGFSIHEVIDRVLERASELAEEYDGQ